VCSSDLDLREGIDLAIYIAGAFERGTRRQYARVVTPGAVVLDIGANIGAHTLPFAHLVGDTGHVYAFEPTKFAFHKLTQNLELNSTLRRRVTAVQALLSDSQTDMVPANIAASWPLDGSAERDADHGGRAVSTDGASLMTLDDFVNQTDIQRVDFVKLDVDGNECSVLRGARDTLRRFQPVIALEIAPYVFAGGNDSFEQFVRLLRDAGYGLWRRPGSGPLPREAEKLRALVPHGASINAWAHPT